MTNVSLKVRWSTPSHDRTLQPDRDPAAHAGTSEPSDALGWEKEKEVDKRARVWGAAAAKDEWSKVNI